MVIMYDRKIKYVAYISRLKCNHLNQRAQMCFCKKSPSALSKFLLKTFSTFTSSENLRFFFHVYIQRMWGHEWGERRKSEILVYNFFFKKLNNIFDYHAGATSFYRPCNVTSMIGRCMDVELTLFSCLTKYGANGPLLKT